MCPEPRSLAVELALLARSTPVVGYQWSPRCSGVDPQLGGTAVLGETLWADRRENRPPPSAYLPRRLSSASGAAGRGKARRLSVSQRRHTPYKEPAVERSRLTLLAVALATFMTYLDNNIINVAIPAIERDLQLTTSGLEWVVSSYILVFASLLLAGGRLADVWGRKRLFLIGLAIFTAASLVAGLAGNVDVLVISRAVRGWGRHWSPRPRWRSSRRPSPRAGNARLLLAFGARPVRSPSLSARCWVVC